MMLFDPKDLPIIKPERETLSQHQLQCVVGGAGEYLVCYDIHRHGLMAGISTMPTRCDVFIETACGDILTVQVKTTSHTYSGNKSLCYHFGGGVAGAKPGEFDIVACVALDIQTIAYIPGDKAKQNMSLGLPGQRRSAGGQGSGRASVYECIDQYPLKDVLESRGYAWQMV